MRFSKFIIKLELTLYLLLNLLLLLQLLTKVILKFYFKSRFTTWFTKLNLSPHWVQTEAEFFIANTASNVVLFLWFVSKDLNLPMETSTPIYVDNNSCITIIHACIPSDRIKYLEVIYFRIQDWKVNKCILMKHIPSIFPPLKFVYKPTQLWKEGRINPVVRLM